METKTTAASEPLTIQQADARRLTRIKHGMSHSRYSFPRARCSIGLTSSPSIRVRVVLISVVDVEVSHLVGALVRRHDAQEVP